jgi:DNA helicase HerA-like ATPase
VYFVTQNPLDVPETVLGQLGNHVQHALRAFTPRDQKAVKTAAETMRANPAFDAATAITELGVGEALVSFLDDKGRPEIVERAMVIAPASRLGPLDAAERSAAIKGSVIYGTYEQAVDRESAYEMLRAKAGSAESAQAAEAGTPAAGNALNDILFGSTGPRGGKRDGLVQIAAKTVTRTIGNSLGRQIVRGILGSLLGGKR